MYSDPIADMLTRIRNGYMVHKKLVKMPYSKMKQAIAKVLQANHYIESSRVVEGDHNKKELAVELSYSNHQAAIKKIRRISKAGRRIYQPSTKLPYVLSGLGIAIISTSQGLMNEKQARKKNLGGEIICEVW